MISYSRQGDGNPVYIVFQGQPLYFYLFFAFYLCVCVCVYTGMNSCMYVEVRRQPWVSELTLFKLFSTVYARLVGLCSPVSVPNPT